MDADIHVVLVFEDELSEAVLRRLLIHSGRPFVVSHGILARGFGNIKRDVSKYKTACRAVPHIVLTDLDQSPCPPALLELWGVVNRPDELLFRVAVREVEAWLLADAAGLAAFMNVLSSRFPAYPESVIDPKQALISVARRSKSRVAREIVPSAGSIASQGPLYNEHLCRFVRDHWNVQAALIKAPSLARTVARLSDFLA